MITLTLIVAKFIFPKRWSKTHNVWIIYTSIWSLIVNSFSVILKRWILMRKCRSLVRLVQNIKRSMHPKRWKCYCTSKMNNKETFLPVKIAVTAFKMRLYMNLDTLFCSIIFFEQWHTANILTRTFYKLKKTPVVVLQYPSSASQSMIYGRLKERQDTAL